MGEEDDDGVYHDEVEIEDFVYDEDTETFTYPCPCGDLFAVSKEDLLNGEDVARCPSCSLVVKVIFNPDEIEAIINSKLKSAKSKTTAKITLETN